MAASLRERVLEHIRERGLFSEPGLALLAISGGADSVAMLDLIAGLATELGLDLAVAHVDHGISRESSAVADSVKTIALRYDVPCHVAVLELGAAASETEARNARYRELRRLQRELGARYLVTAHQLDDQAETVLYRLLKGSGVAGLAGIPERGPEGLVRPLLPFRRHELQAWASRGGPDGEPLPLHRDPANENPRHDRSWLRHDLWPVAAARFGDGLADRLSDVARSARCERAAWAALLRAWPELAFRAEPHAATLARVPLQRYDNVLSEALLRALAREVGCMLGAERVGRLLELLRSGKSGRILELGKGWEAECSFDRVRIQRTPSSEELPSATLGDSGEGAVRWGSWEFTWQSGAAGRVIRRGLTTWVSPGAMQIRRALPGDRIVPLGGTGRRKVRRLLMEERVPLRSRASYPMIVRGSLVLWVPGVCRSNQSVPAFHQASVKLVAWPPGGSRMCREPDCVWGG